MADQWLHMYHQNDLSNNRLPFHLSDYDHDHLNNSGLVSDSTVVTAAVSSATTPPASSGLSPDGGRVVKPVRKRSRASRRTPTTLLNTDAANFRAMVQQFTGGPSNNHNSNNAPNFAAFGFPGNSHTVYDPSAAAVAAYHLQAPPQQQQPLFQFQNQPPSLQQQQPPFMFSSLSNSAAGEAFFQGGGSRSNINNVNYMGIFDGSSPAAQNPRPA